MYRPAVCFRLSGHFHAEKVETLSGEILRLRLLRLCVEQRFGVVGKMGSIALIERLWRTLKDALGLHLLRPSAAEDLTATVELGLLHYAHFRPNQGIGGATPAEIFFRRTPAHFSAIPPPRSRVGEGPMDLPFLIDYLDAERLLPALVQRAARRKVTPEKDIGRRVRAWRDRSDRTPGLCAPTPAAIPIAPLQPSYAVLRRTPTSTNGRRLLSAYPDDARPRGGRAVAGSSAQCSALRPFARRCPMSQEAALSFVGRVVTDKDFADRLSSALSNLTDPAARAGRLSEFARKQGYDVVPDELVPYLPPVPAELAEADLEKVAGGVGGFSAPAASRLALLCSGTGGSPAYAMDCVQLNPSRNRN